MSYTYSARKRTEQSPTQKDASPQQPGMDALRAGAAQPTAEQMGHRVDLPDAMRSKMENAFGADLSAVKLYESQAVADAGAKAMAQGASIAFAPGMLDFTSFGGQALLGHEISHVVSQARGEVTGGGFLNDASLEARADREGTMAASGQSVAMPTAAVSSVSAASAAGPMQAKGKKGKKSDAAQIADGMHMGPSDEQKQWHSMLTPEAQKYVTAKSMQSAPTASPEEMDRQVAQRRAYSDAQGVRNEGFLKGLRSFYNDPNATSQNSGAGEMGRRMEAMYDFSGSPEADAFNQNMFTTLDQVQKLSLQSKSLGTKATADDALVAQLAQLFAPTVAETMRLNQAGTDFKQYGSEHYSDASMLSGRTHALSDTLKVFDPETQEKVMQQAGMQGGFGDFRKMEAAMTVGINQGWKQDAANLGTSNAKEIVQSMAVEREEAAKARAAQQAAFVPGQGPKETMSYRSDEIGALAADPRFDIDPTSSDPQMMAVIARRQYDKLKALQKSGADPEEIRRAVEDFKESRARQGRGWH